MALLPGLGGQEGHASAQEPLGRRIIEIPEDVSRTELRDASSGFVADYLEALAAANGTS